MSLFNAFSAVKIVRREADNAHQKKAHTQMILGR